MSEVPPEVRQAVESFAPHPHVDRKWHPVPSDGNYDPTATLSATLHTIEMATVSSPMHIALYHKGEFRGQGTPKAGAFVSLRHDACTDDTVAVRLKIPGSSHVETKSLHDVEFVWRNGRIFWRGDWPHDAYAPPLPGWSEVDD
ncbi:hypothetical protein A5659_18565 [Mycobacterium sp. 1165196.3]|uniref:LppP/LprE family lipoprotein n=1 Tax=Mycobacterium sp. 1165196.3 TaxID=1834071 RepID=UPI0007FDB7A9|nr:LppP/LprE family lipoprotein [Mycobacterium sp. 1165196.3]OBK36638.1 hypothetical protein A5659_18565 [Mycobacterium sp. 1165196.3]